jgi:hypothetical protein
MNHRNLVLLAALAAFSATASFAEDKPPSGQEIEALIQQLVSKYPPPSHDTSGQVHTAFKHIQELGLLAFPYLFDHFDDKRYSFTADKGSSDHNWSVGEACSDIVRCHLEPFGTFSNSFAGRRRPNYSAHSKLRGREQAKAWWETHKQKSLRELQIEALEWVVAEEAKTPEWYSEEERADLQETLTKLRASDVPLPPRVPWAK